MLYREWHLCDEVIFDWEAASNIVPRDELVVSLQSDMIDAINQLENLTNSEDREVELKKIEFLRVSVVRARLGKEMISLVFPISKAQLKPRIAEAVEEQSRNGGYSR